MYDQIVYFLPILNSSLLEGHLGNYGDNKMKQEHGDYMLSLQLGQSIEKRKSLFSLIDKDIKKPKRGSDMAYFSLVTLENVKFFFFFQKQSSKCFLLDYYFS